MLTDDARSDRDAQAASIDRILSALQGVWYPVWVLFNGPVYDRSLQTTAFARSGQHRTQTGRQGFGMVMVAWPERNQPSLMVQYLWLGNRSVQRSADLTEIAVRHDPRFWPCRWGRGHAAGHCLPGR